jgi:hypothetical protein
MLAMKTGLAVGIIIVAAIGAQAQNYGPWGVIAYSPMTGASAYRIWFNNRADAANAAMASCSELADDCTVAVQFYRSCGAVAAGLDGWATATRSEIKPAEQAALEECQKTSQECQLVESLCS